MAIFMDRVAELPRLLDALQYHPDGLRIEDLAAEVGRSPDQVREALLTYYTADLALYDSNLVGRPPAIEFVLGSGDGDDLDRASIVRLQAAEPGRELGVAYLSVMELARLYRAGRDRLELDPDNDLLRSAVNKLRAGLLPGITPTVRGPREPPPAVFDLARRHQQRIKIVYADAWHTGASEQVIEPYHLVHTRRGWEVDAGPVTAEGTVATFLVEQVSSYTLLDATFKMPANLEELLARHRAVIPVDLIVPHETRWAVEKYADRVDVLAEDETTVQLRAWVGHPVRHRVGLILTDGGPTARVLAPTDLCEAGRDLAGYRTYFTTAADLAARCHRAAIEGRWATTMRFYAGPTLLAIDELGYLPLPAEAASALFQVVSQRYLKTSIVLTTNRGVGAWGDILGDTTVAAAMLDRLLHRSVVINLDGDSYRLRDHHARNEQLRRTTTGTRQPLR